MSLDSADPLLQPITIKSTVFRNRIMSTSHACGLEEGGMPKDAYQAYHLEKAKGGIGLSMIGGSSNVDVDSPNIFRQLNVGDDKIIPHLLRFSTRMHAEGAGIMCQITHLGRRGDSYAGAWLPTISPSAIRETMHRSIPKVMDEYDIQRVVKAYAAAAHRCEEGGLNGIETLAGGHLIGQFLSERTNKRTDKFGGSLENRCRFALMVHDAIRKAVSDKFLVGMRFVVDEGLDDGMRFDECVEAALILKRAGAIDFFNAIYGTMDTIRALATENMPGMGSPIAPFLDVVGKFRQEVNVPVFHAARISDVASARYAIESGKVDMIGMTRAHIADPYIVKKLMSGQEARIRPCVGATHCQSQYRPSCLHNPASGRELLIPQIISKTTGPIHKIIIVGAGPGGLEAARICAQRGHDVSVYEAAPSAGGQLCYSASSAMRRDLMAIIDWRIAELEQLRVPIHYNKYMEYEGILELQPDIVILATGGIPTLDGIVNGDLAVSSWDILSGSVELQGDVLIYDGTGRHPAPMVAVRASEQGHSVKYVSIDTEICKELTYAEQFAFKKRLVELGKMEFIAESHPINIEKSGRIYEVDVVNDITNNHAAHTADTVVIEQGTVPITDLFDALRAHAVNHGVVEIQALAQAEKQPKMDGHGFYLYRIGDAISSRNVQAAMFDAARLCNVM